MPYGIRDLMKRDVREQDRRCVCKVFRESTVHNAWLSDVLECVEKVVEHHF